MNESESHILICISEKKVSEKWKLQEKKDRHYDTDYIKFQNIK